MSKIDSLSIIDYFKFKNKHNFSFTHEELIVFKLKVQEFINSLGEFDSIVIPQTSNNLFKEIINEIGNVCIIPKRSVIEVLGDLDLHHMMKEERNKLYSNLHQMDEIKIHLIAGNQRSRVADVLFDIPEHDLSNSLFIDDAIFSGSTFNAMVNSIKPKESAVIFSYMD